MKKIILLTLLPFFSYAGCTGSDYMQTCNDDSGNRYTVTRDGDTTTVRGHNYQTGSDWRQTSTTNGNVTNAHGYDADGNYWRSTTTTNGDGTYSVHGTDSNGNYFSKRCNRNGCN